MAELAIIGKILCSGLKTVIPILKDEFSKLLAVEETFRALKTSLKGAEKLLLQIDLSEDILLRKQVNHLQRFCYEVEDCIHDMDNEIKKKDPEFRHRKPALDAAKSFENLLEPHKIFKIMIELKSIMEQVETNRQSKNDCEAKVPPEWVNFRFNRLESVGIGENIISDIIEELINCEDSNGVSIAGIRGMGKQALAEYIVGSKEVREKFPLILKASFSGSSFKEENLSNLEILHSASYMKCLQQCGQNLLEELKKQNKQNKQWLLWIDDLSHMPLDRWEYFKSSYLINAKAKGPSKVLITTLNPDVARTTKTLLHHMEELTDTCCQNLIDESFATNNLNFSSFSYGSVATVAEKCYGSPLVAKHLASALCKHNKNYQHIVDEQLWHLSEFKEELLPYLASSFRSLKGDRLKFFYYLSLFPQLHKFDEEDLILLWIGAGLIQPQTSDTKFSRFLKDARDCFNDLLNNSILLPLPGEEDSIRYQMNKLAHSFAQYFAPQVYVRWEESSQPEDLDNIDICHLSLACNMPSDPSNHLWEKIKTRKCLRTFLSIFDSNCPGQLKGIPPDIFSIMADLRVLVLKNTNTDRFPNSLSSLKRLRYVDISETFITCLSDDLCSLTNLQILKMKRTIKPNGRSNESFSLQISRNFSNLTNLVFVDWEANDIKSKLLSMPAYIGKLVNLETLPYFEVGTQDGHQIRELKEMNRLKKSIHITKLENVRDGKQAKDACIYMKTALQSLELEWINDHGGKSSHEKASEVLDNLKPHDKLGELKILNYRGVEFPRWFSKDTFQLKKLHLKNCTKCNLLPSLGLLPALEAIHLEEMPCLRFIDNLFSETLENGTIGNLKSLKSLQLSDLGALENWTTLGINDMPKLCKLKINKCIRLKILPPSLDHLTSLTAIEIEGCSILLSLPKLPLSSLTLLTINDSQTLANWCATQVQLWTMEYHNKLKVTIDYEHIQLPMNENFQRRFVAKINNLLPKIFFAMTLIIARSLKVKSNFINISKFSLLLVVIMLSSSMTILTCLL